MLGKVPETARSPQNGSEAFSAVRARDVMVNTTCLAYFFSGFTSVKTIQGNDYAHSA